MADSVTSRRSHRHSYLRLLLCIVAASAVRAKEPKNRTLGAWSIPRCDEAARAPSHSGPIPKQACARDDLGRHDLCSLLARSPPMVPAALMAKARVHPERRQALEQHVVPRQGGRMVEVGTMTGVLAKYIIRTFSPAELTVMDVDSWAINQCRGRVSQVGREANATVKCIKGDSKTNLQALEDNAYDLIYIDGAHDYKGVCGDAEAARTKVKVGGVMAFNDYYIFEWGFLAKKGRWGVYGVVHAANEFLIRYQPDWELIYYTFGLGGSDGGDLGLRRLR